MKHLLNVRSFSDDGMVWFYEGMKKDFIYVLPGETFEWGTFYRQKAGICIKRLNISFSHWRKIVEAVHAVQNSDEQS